ncbi:hypothetical protein COLO4_20350 [Corchorus olitorius]|uniref:AAA+ ATPase domain-containing protein n=1 Tax=Corchorus olitorius TaxID=93759 RepID=A0A1R3J068_9ROSI|nr:hypothetical protein COLO4_20350 [Corchorus olitorius]
MLVRGVVTEVQAITSQLIPTQLQAFLLSKLGGLIYSNPSSQMTTLLIDEYNGYSINELYEASQIYLQTKITPSIERLKVSKGPKDKKVAVVKLLSLGNMCGGEMDGLWGSTNLDHPATFDKLAMDPVLKKELIDDLDRFVRRRNFYKKVGKAWKRGYLLYGPPGTGKSSLVAAMANYLKFNVYDLELSSIYNNSNLRRLLVSTRNRSIVVIEDIDCSIDLEDRQAGGQGRQGKGQLTLSGLLNFIDGLWSSCGDERIIVFTTNHKDKLDPALLRPGRMDMHIHMSYCTPIEVTPAEIAEELMKSEDVDIALEGLIKFLLNKKLGSGKLDSDGEEEAGFEEESESNECDIEVAGNKRKTQGSISEIDKAAAKIEKKRKLTKFT